MSDQSKQEDLIQKIEALEALVQQKDEDLSIYRQELLKANQRLESLIAELQSDFRTLQSLQRALVPTDLPSITGVELSSKFVPSMVMGGDYFDVFEHEDRLRFGVLMAAASGHATSALLLSVLLKLSGPLEARRSTDPAQVVKSIHDEISNEIKGNELADLAYAVVDRRDFSFKLCSAGQITAIYQEAGSGKVTLLPSHREPLASGVIESLETHEFGLNPRDRVVFCSPGLIESTNLDGEAYGRERIVESVLSAPKTGVHELRNHVLMQLEKFTKGCEPQRDRSVIALEIKDRVIKLAR